MQNRQATPLKTVGFIGLGVMGGPMAGHLLRHGFAVRVWNRTGSRAETWLAAQPSESRAQAVVANSPREVAVEADALCVCVGNDEDVHAVLNGEQGALAGLAAGTLLIDHSTVSATLARELAERAAALSIHWLDAPVSGGQAGAENGKLTIMCGGTPEAFARAESILECYGQRSRLLGPAGAGQLTKMVNQICIAGLLQGLAEGVQFAEHAGLSPEAVFDVIGAGAAGSWQLENRALSMHERRFDFGFAVDWMRKDLGIALAEASRNGSSLPVTALVDQFYSELQNRGGGRLDTSSLLLRLDSTS